MIINQYKDPYEKHQWLPVFPGKVRGLNYPMRNHPGKKNTSKDWLVVLFLFFIFIPIPGEMIQFD